MSKVTSTGHETAEGTPHVLPMRTYFAIFGALLVLTGVTVGVSYADLGKPALYVAMFIAFIKAGLVVGYFMHLKYDSRFHQLVFFASGAFILLMFLFTFLDLSSRATIYADQDTQALEVERNAVEREATVRQELAAIKPKPPAPTGVTPTPAATTSASSTPATTSVDGRAPAPIDAGTSR